MLLLLDLLEHPVFSGFHLENSTDCLYNQVATTALLQWERTPQEMMSFMAQDFVLSTITVDQPPEDVWPRIRMLIQRRVAAIAIKSRYPVPAEIIREADTCGVAVFTFPAEVYVEDVIYAICGTLDSRSLNLTHAKKILALIPDDVAAQSNILCASAFNPYFFRNFCCCMCRPVSADRKTQHEQLLRIWRAYTRKAGSFHAADVVHSSVFLEEGIIVILTFKDPALCTEKVLLKLLDTMDISGDAWTYGRSRTFIDADEALGTAVLECLYHAIGQSNLPAAKRPATSAGTRGLLPAFAFHPQTNLYFSEFYPVITNYDAAHNTNLLQTLRDYFENGMDISTTARIQCQHANTIRYRMEKIRSLLEIPNSPDGNCQLYVFYQLLRAREQLSDIKKHGVLTEYS